MSETGKQSKPWRLKFHLNHHDDRKASLVPGKKEEKIVITTRHSLSGPTKPILKSHQFIDYTKNVPKDIPYPPFVNIDGVPNFRDIGGYTCTTSTGEGYSVRQGYAFRCAELSQITQSGNLAMVKTLKIGTLFDLRSEEEAANPTGQPKGLKNVSVPVFRKSDITFVMGYQQLQWSTAPDASKKAGFSQGYVDWYRQIAEYGAKSAYRQIFEYIRDHPNEPFGFHCTAGKDRTGVLSAIILKLCGVDDETIAWEYSLTVPGMGAWEAMVEGEMVGDSMMPLRAHGGMTQEEAHRVCGSRASNMEKWLKVVLAGELGGPRKYLKDLCGFSDADVETIRNNLLVAGEGPVKVVELPSADHPQT